MSIGNKKTEGSKGANFSWQHKVLIGLAKGAANTAGVEVNTNPLVKTPNFIRASGVSGTVAPKAYSMSFASVGTGNATVGGMTLKPGETINFDAGALNNTLPEVTYDTTAPGAELIIIKLT